MTELEVIARAIGYHFWKCDTDDEAIRAGMDAAEEVQRALAELSRGSR